MPVTALAFSTAPHAAGDIFHMQPHSILHFWFTELTPKDHFAKDAALDDTIRSGFGATLAAAVRCELFAWRATPEGRLVEVLVLDQFSRNVYRDSPRAFAQDALALALAQELVASGQDRSLPLAQRSFAYMHSESALVHAQAVALFAQPGMEDTLRFEQRHQAITLRFGRYPHPFIPNLCHPGPRVHARGAGVFEGAGVGVLTSA
jgi:uncharacterized protein (DUF924 family)